MEPLIVSDNVLMSRSALLRGALHAGHVNHSMFWKNLTPPDVRLASPNSSGPSACVGMILVRPAQCKRCTESCALGLKPPVLPSAEV